MNDTPLLPLEYPTQPNPPPRPRISDEAVLKVAAQDCLEEVVEDWLGDDYDAEKDYEHTLDQLSQMLARGHYDGYERARFLENHFYWSPDAELVEILDGDFLYLPHRAAVEAWVEANQIKPFHAVGDVLQTRHGTGRVVAIYARTAEYVVQTAEYLDRHPAQTGTTGGTLVAFEDCKIPEDIAA